MLYPGYPLFQHLKTNRWPPPSARASAFLLSVCLTLLPASSWAQYSGADSLVSRSIRGSDLLKVDTFLENPLPTCMGVAHVTVQSVTPSKSDRDLVVVLYIRPVATGAGDGLAYHVPLRLDEGKSRVEVEIPYIHSQSQFTWDVGLTEDGRNIEDRRRNSATDPGYQWFHDASGSQFALAGLYASMESERALRADLNQLSRALAINPRANPGSGPNATADVRLLSVGEASHDWRKYFCYSSWTLSAQALKELGDRPQQSAALRTYVAAGGLLLVHTADQAQSLAEIDQFLSGSSAAAQTSRWSALSSVQSPWWQLAADQEATAVIEPSQASAGISVGSEGYIGGRPASNASSIQRPNFAAPLNSSTAGQLSGLPVAQDAAIWAETWLQDRLGSHLDRIAEASSLFIEERSATSALDALRTQLIQVLSSRRILTRPYAFGTVLISSDPLNQIPLSVLAQTQFASNTASRRLSNEMDGNWFWRNLIHAVGKPPIWMFCVIVTLFGALLGPGLLTLTGRIGRRSLMIFLVPSISLFATAAIVLYGILHEGFGTHLRITSVQAIDVDAGQGFVWSRQNFFSGLPPHSGLNFSANTYVRPVHSDDQWSRKYGLYEPRRGIGGHVRLLDGKQNWRGWLKPRLQQQLLVGHPLQKPTSPIAVRRSKNSTVTVENLTQSTLPIVVFRGAEDDYYATNNLHGGARVVVTPSDLDAVSADVAQRLAEYRPAAPVELQEGGSLLDFGRSGYRGRSTDLLEAEDVLNLCFRQNLSDRLALPFFGFSVLARESDAVEVPLEGKSSENLHLIFGVKQW